jgi:hypothetical protein
VQWEEQKAIQLSTTLRKNKPSSRSIGKKEAYILLVTLESPLTMMQWGGKRLSSSANGKKEKCLVDDAGGSKRQI